MHKHLWRLKCPHLTPLLSISIYTTALAKALMSHQNQTKCAHQNPKRFLCLPSWMGAESHSSSDAQMVGIPVSAKSIWLKSVGLITLATSSRSKWECSLPEGVRADTPLGTPHGAASCRSPSLHSVFCLPHLISAWWHALPPSAITWENCLTEGKMCVKMQVWVPAGDVTQSGNMGSGLSDKCSN